jgi:hypothetical protein
MENKRKEVKERLVGLFGLRLQSLIGFEDANRMEQIVEYFLRWMEKLSRLRGNHNQYKNRLDDIHKILYFMNETEDLNSRSTHIGDTINSIKNLCSYVEFLYNQLAKQVCKKEELDGDIRKIIGIKFYEKMQQIDRSPSRHDIYNQLNVATLQRNSFFHEHKDGDSKSYKGYELLIGYDILMACLLYTFYKMVFDDSYVTE